MVRILQVTKELGSGGIEAVVCGWYNNIDREKIDFDFALHCHGRKGMHEDEVLQKGARIYRFRTLAECGSICKYKKQWAMFWREHLGEYSVAHIHYMSHAALTADEIAESADFFSFGTNDLTQMTFGFSRDDAGKFLDSYYQAKIYESDPFAKLDQKGVGQLVKMAAEKGRKTNPDLHLGICGEHGGDPSSVEFCYNAGLDYVSCSPFRVPIARLAAAQAVLNAKK